MKTIWKYQLEITDIQTVEAAPGRVLTCPSAGEESLCIWVEVDTTNSIPSKRTFVVVGTGHQFEEKGLSYCGTVQMLGGRLVWHVYEMAD